MLEANSSENAINNKTVWEELLPSIHPRLNLLSAYLLFTFSLLLIWKIFNNF